MQATRYIVREDPDARSSARFRVIDTATGMIETSSPSRAGANRTARALNERYDRRRALEALPAPTCGMAGWGVADPDQPGEWLADGYGTADRATTAAHMAYTYMHRDGMHRREAQVLAAAAMDDAELGEYSDYSKDCTGSRCRTVEGLRGYRAQAWAEQYAATRHAQATGQPWQAPMVGA